MIAMTERIGTTAGKVWQVLRTQQEADINRLPRMVSEKSVVVNQALGWLAREGKLEYREQGERLWVSLNQHERSS
jgi:hypothetical protein